MTKLLTILALLVATEALAAERRVTFTYPMPAKLRPADPMAIAPGSEIPQHPERFTWKTAPRPRADKKPSTDKTVPVYMEDDGGHPTIVGSLPVGTEVKLETVRTFGRAHYYAVPWEAKPGQANKTAWIAGANVVPAGTVAVGQ